MIPLGGKGGVTVVDREMAHLDGKFWCRSSHGYAVTGAGKNRQYMHHAVLGKPPTGLVTDHINRDRLDNRRANLRFVTQKVNINNSVLVGRTRQKRIAP